MQGNYDDLDRMMEERFKYGDLGGDDAALLDEEDDHNNETFADDVAAIKGRDFDFGAPSSRPGQHDERAFAKEPARQHFPAGPARPMPMPQPFPGQGWMNQMPGQMPFGYSASPPMMPPMMQRPMMTVEEIEAQMRMQARGPAPPPPGYGYMPPPMPPPGAYMSVQELEAQFRNMNAAPRPFPPDARPDMRQEMRQQDMRQEARHQELRQDARREEQRHQQEQRAYQEQRGQRPDRPGTRQEQRQGGREDQKQGGRDNQRQQERQERQPSRQERHYETRSEQRQLDPRDNRQDADKFPSLEEASHADKGRRQQVRQEGQEGDRDKSRQKQIIYSTNRQQQQSKGEFEKKQFKLGFNGLMTSFDKNLIARIQVSQLVSNQPFKDDYYYQMYKLKKAGDGEEGQTDGKYKWKQTLFAQSNAGTVEKLPSLVRHLKNQMQKIIDGKKVEKNSSLTLEGALGKIALNTTKNPRPSLAIPEVLSNTSTMGKDNKLSAKHVLRLIEDVYSRLLDLEAVRQSPPEEDEDKSEWETALKKAQQDLWTSLQCEQAIPLTAPHPTPSLLIYGKGKKVIPRVLKYLTLEQTQSFFAVLLKRIECIDVMHVPLSTPNDEVEVFMSKVIPSLVLFISEIPLSVMNNYLRTLLERHNMAWFTTSKVGLAIMTMLLSRAEILRQGAPETDSEVTMWNDLYAYLFQTFQGKYATLFPKSEQNEVYVWQFLSAMAVGASTIDQQRVLVTEVREKVIETAKRSNPKALANVDLFLNALGLNIDAQQLAMMPL